MSVLAVNITVYMMALTLTVVLLLSTVAIFIVRRTARAAPIRLLLLTGVLGVYAFSPFVFDIVIRAWFTRGATLASAWVDLAWWFLLVPAVLAGGSSWLLLRWVDKRRTSSDHVALRCKGLELHEDHG
jgi:hypothetical protein